MGYFLVKNDTIFIDGHDINKYSIESIRSQIIYLNQMILKRSSELFSRT